MNVSENHSLCTGVHLPGNREAGVAALFVKDGMEAADVFFVIGYYLFNKDAAIR
ncbi:hypothetical protein KSF_012600 [Reticulibacter mediterranei]|uniref:Uncharacterized protein n=1 Tax=Reticulibacter mediterranei TaxID=2778369 RepID=A0A8J3IGR8_9CHLR|nr:hypothetical protein KSF_012600 [Reticulibacter mediterranei]